MPSRNKVRAFRVQSFSAHIRRVLISWLLVTSLTGCTRTVIAVPDTLPPETSIPSGDLLRAAMQEYADLAMAAMGDSYRLAASQGEVSEAAVVFLRDGFGGTALEGEESNLADAIDFRNSLARVPGNPRLLIDIVTDQTPVCLVAEAEFDDRPLLAFPTANAGVPVVARMRQTADEAVWRVDVLVSPEQASLNPVRCPEYIEGDDSLVGAGESGGTASSTAPTSRAN
jgi:hypothetical protein